MHMSGRERPILLYDGDCAFCTWCAGLLGRIEPDAEIVAWQFADLAALGVTEQQTIEAVQWVEVDGGVRSGHEAIAAVLNTSGLMWKIAGHLILLPGVSWVASKAYRLVADNRYRLPGSTPACRRPRSG
jgi:predicted DCC family thiol-disulfide oxidoreductase YuxK